MLEPLSLLEPVRDEAGECIDFRWLFINDAGAADLAFRTDNLVGRRILDVIPEAAEHLVPRYKEVLATGEAVTDEETTYQHWDENSTQSVTLTLRIVKCGDCIAVSWKNVTTEVEHRQRGEVAASRFTTLTENAPIGHAVVGLDGSFIEVNRAFCQIAGYSRSELVSKTFQEITHPDDLAVDDSQANAVASGAIESYTLDKRYVRKDGSPVWIKLFVSAELDADGTPIQFLAQAIDIDKQKRAESEASRALESLAYRSTHDPLTDLPNRDECVRALRQGLSDPVSRISTGVLFIDIDNFKEINDGISHTAGDVVLVEVGQRIRSAVRAEDLVCRLGGDEFAVVTTNQESRHDLEYLSERIRRGIARSKFDLGGTKIHVTVSIGASGAHHDSTPQTLLSEADLAVFQAKALGRDRWQVADRRMLQQAQDRLSTITAIQHGIANHEFHAWYQPIVDLATREVVGYESLARWIRDGEAVNAESFIRVAEESGLINEIGGIVINESLRHLVNLEPHQQLAVNASPQQLQMPMFARDMLTTISDEGARASQVVLEITEQALLRASSVVDNNINELHASGVQIYVDDFGVGYSSLAILRDYPISGIKLDRSFSDTPASRTGSRAKLVSGLSQLAQHLGMDRIAEGVSSEEHLDYLQEAGWTKGQGYMLGRPAPGQSNGGAIPTQSTGVIGNLAPWLVS